MEPALHKIREQHTARRSRNQRRPHRRDAEKNKKSNCSAYSAFLAAHLYFRSTDVRVQCFVRLLTEQKLKVLCVSAVNSPFPRVGCKEGRVRREKSLQKSKKLAVSSTKGTKRSHKRHKKFSFLCFLCALCAFCGLFPLLLGKADPLRCAVCCVIYCG